MNREVKYWYQKQLLKYSNEVFALVFVKSICTTLIEMSESRTANDLRALYHLLLGDCGRLRVCQNLTLNHELWKHGMDFACIGFNLVLPDSEPTSSFHNVDYNSSKCSMTDWNFKLEENHTLECHVGQSKCIVITMYNYTCFYVYLCMFISSSSIGCRPKHSITTHHTITTHKTQLKTEKHLKGSPTNDISFILISWWWR